ncbi:MAG: glutathione S-transferase family protein [Pseudomonadales bacterium]|nr:glutathione S-transferase family protein [Pseudomonadales bacterium]
MLTLHHLEYSQSFRILWLLEELGTDYELKLYARNKETYQAPDEYKTLSPLGSAPVITEGDLALAESSAIIDYVLDQHPESNLRPAIDDEDRVRYLFWFHASQGSMMMVLIMEAVFQILIQRVPFWMRGLIRGVLGQASERMIKPRMEKLLQLAEKDLAQKPWFGGDKLSAADIAMSYPMESARSRGFITDQHPNCLAWIERVHQNPSFQRAKEKDGKDSIVLQV